MAWKKPNEELKNVGLIGCGRMGFCMLESMKNKGFTVYVYDVFEKAVDRAVTAGGIKCSSPSEIAKNAKVVIMSLPGPVQIEEAVFGDNGIVKSVTDEHIIIDTSTVDPGTSKNNSKRISELAGTYLDCSILGRPSATGKWMLPTGGDEEALEYAKPALLTFAVNAIHVGESGAGNALKLLNQMMFTCINAISSEVMAIADHVGIKKEVFYDTVASSSAATVSGLFKEVGKSIINDAYETPAFTVDLLIKDTKLALQMARDNDCMSVIASTAQMYNEIAHGKGLGNQDSSALYKVFSEHFNKIS